MTTKMRMPPLHHQKREPRGGLREERRSAAAAASSASSDDDDSCAYISRFYSCFFTLFSCTYSLPFFSRRCVIFFFSFFFLHTHTSSIEKTKIWFQQTSRCCLWFVKKEKKKKKKFEPNDERITSLKFLSFLRSRGREFCLKKFKNRFLFNARAHKKTREIASTWGRLTLLTRGLRVRRQKRKRNQIHR